METDDPLVLAFADLSGHGKIELPRAMGKLLSAKTCALDCASTKDNWGLFGATCGCESNMNGSQVNNNLAEISEQRLVVFLDEFDKKYEEVRNALLVTTERGSFITLSVGKMQ